MFARSARPAPDTARRAWRRLPLALCGLLVIAYVAFFGWLAVMRHQMFRSSAMDLGYTTQVVWNTAQGRPFEFSTFENAPIDLPLKQFKRTDNLLSYHVELLLIPIALLYRVFPDPVTLLILQVIVIGLGALPAFWIARKRLASEWAGLAFAATYLLAPALNGAVLSDFHAVSLTAALLLYAFHFLEQGRRGVFLALVVVSMSAKEDIPLLAFMLGLYLFVWRRERRLGTITAALGIGWFLVATRLIQPQFHGLPDSPFLQRLAIFGPTVKDTFVNALRDPGLVFAWLAQPAVARYLLGLLATGGFMPLFSPITAAIGAPILIINIFSSWDWTYSEGAHYSASMIPIIVVAAVYGTEWLARRIAHFARAPYARVTTSLAVVMLAIGLLHQWRIGQAPFAQSYQRPTLSEHHRLGHQIIAAFPPDASVSAQANLYPHIAQRRQAYLFPAVNGAEYILLDMTSSPFPVDVASLSSEVQFLLEHGEYGVIEAQDGYLVLKRGAAHGLQGAAWRAFLTFARADQPPRYTAAVRFGDALELVGYDYDVHNVVTAGQLPATVITYWRALQPLTADYAISVYFTRADGAVVGSYHDGLAALSWYPTRAWQPGEVIRVETPILAIGRDRGVLIGVGQGISAPDQPDRRLPPALKGVSIGNGAPPKVLAEARLVEIFRFGH
jgi:uncharacterized membrane protein